MYRFATARSLFHIDPAHQCDSGVSVREDSDEGVTGLLVGCALLRIRDEMCLMNPPVREKSGGEIYVLDDQDILCIRLFVVFMPGCSI